MKFSIKGFFSKCDRIRSFLRNFCKFFNGKLHFLCSDPITTVNIKVMWSLSVDVEVWSWCRYRGKCPWEKSPLKKAPEKVAPGNMRPPENVPPKKCPPGKLPPEKLLYSIFVAFDIILRFFLLNLSIVTSFRGVSGTPATSIINLLVTVVNGIN